MQFGKSKAKFQMEPNTGITFDDVAGVDEAKQDFMEVSLLSRLQSITRDAFCEERIVEPLLRIVWEECTGTSLCVVSRSATWPAGC